MEADSEHIEDVRYDGTLARFTSGSAVQHAIEAIYTPANVQGIMASGPAGALRLAAGADVERELRERVPLLLGAAYLTGAGRLSAHGVERIVHGVTNQRPGDPPKRAHVERALVAALEMIDREGTRQLSLPEVGTRIAGVSVAEAAELLAVTVAARVRRGTTLEQIVFASLNPTYLRACRLALTGQGWTDA